MYVPPSSGDFPRATVRNPAHARAVLWAALPFSVFLAFFVFVVGAWAVTAVGASESIGVLGLLVAFDAFFTALFYFVCTSNTPSPVSCYNGVLVFVAHRVEAGFLSGSEVRLDLAEAGIHPYGKRDFLF